VSAVLWSSFIFAERVRTVIQPLQVVLGLSVYG